MNQKTHALRLTLTTIVTFMVFNLFAQEVILRTYNGIFKADDLKKVGNRFEFKMFNSRKTVSMHELKVFSYSNQYGEVTMVTDSAIYSRKKRYNKPYSNLKPVAVKTNHSFLYNKNVVISEKDFLAILKNIHNPEIQNQLKYFNKNINIRRVLLISSGLLIVGGTYSLLNGLNNSSGRNSYPSEKRQQAGSQVSLGVGLLSTAALFSISTVIFSIKNHRHVRKKLLPLYNQIIP